MKTSKNLAVVCFGAICLPSLFAAELPDRPTTVLYPQVHCLKGDLVSGSGAGLFFANIYDPTLVQQVNEALELPENLGAKYGGVVRIQKDEKTEYVSVGFISGHSDQNGEYHDAAGHTLKRAGYSAKLDLYGGTSPRPEDRKLLTSLEFNQCKDLGKDLYKESQEFGSPSGETIYLQFSYSWDQPNASGGTTVKLSESSVGVYLQDGDPEAKYEAKLKSICDNNVFPETKTFEVKTDLIFQKQDFASRSYYRGILEPEEFWLKSYDYRGYGYYCKMVFELTKDGEAINNVYTGTPEFPFNAPRISRIP